MNFAPWWYGSLAAVVFFAYFEWKGWLTSSTLSRWIYTIGKDWPLSIFLMGQFAGGLAVHFFWHWCPDGGIGTGLLEWPTTFKAVFSAG